MSKKHLFLFIFSCFLSLQCFTQTQNANPGQSFSNGNFDECIKACDKVLEGDENDSGAHFFKGASLVRLKKYQAAKKHLAKARENNYQPAAAVNSNLLRAYGGLEETDTLLDSLQSMSENGFRASFVLNSEEFKYLEGDITFNKLKKKVDENANPCLYGSQYKRLDFWLGEWEVFVNDAKIATSSITKSEGGCTLYEDYKTTTGFLGRSTNYYDPTDKLYTQIWIDKFNSISTFKEDASKEGYLQMTADDGAGNLTRMTYVQDKIKDTVTQTVDSSTDKGKTWVTGFVGVYKRKK